MVAGADTMLNKLSNNGTECALTASEDYFEGAEELKLVTRYKDEHGDYMLEYYKGERIGSQDVALSCDNLCIWTITRSDLFKKAVVSK